MRSALLGIGLICVLALAGCGGGAHGALATVHGEVRLVGGPATRHDQASVHLGQGSVLVFATRERAGRPLLTVHIDTTGSYSFRARPGTYFLATTAATSDGVPFDGPTIDVGAGRVVRADIDCQIR
jgi:hypothetical protein